MNYKKGTFSRRFFAFLIDWVIILSVLNFGWFTTEERIIYYFPLFFFYNFLFIWIFGTTPGKKLFRLKVVNTSYKKTGFWKALVRESIGKILSSMLYLGYFWILCDKKAQAWHDKLAHTYVVQTDKKGELVPGDDPKPYSKWLVALIPVLFVAFIVGYVVVASFVAEPVKVSGRSMDPNYQDGEYYIVHKSAYQSDLPKRGDVITFHPPRDPKQSFISRVIGLPGDRIKIENGEVFINGQRLKEPYLASGTRTDTRGYMVEAEEINIPENSYFVMGDNRSYSSDSREYGFVSKEGIIGKVWFRYN